MISIIVCSPKTRPNPLLVTNIEETIGVEFEIVWIDNSDRKYSIFEAYNTGVNQSKFPYLCFMHDDVKILTKSWGPEIISQLEEQDVGIVGVAGCHYLPKMPSAINSARDHSINIIQREGDSGILVKHFRIPPINNRIECVALDGVWLCLKKCTFDEIKFDHQTYSGFHFYDIDLCLQLRMIGLKSFMLSNILLEHESGGTRDYQWLSEAMRYHEKWKCKLPISQFEMGAQDLFDANLRVFDDIVFQVFYQHGIKIKYLFQVWIILIKSNPKFLIHLYTYKVLFNLLLKCGRN